MAPVDGCDRFSARAGPKRFDRPTRHRAVRTGGGARGRPHAVALPVGRSGL